jgi:hypothetical protein
MSEEFLSPSRVPVLEKVLYAVLGLAALLAVVALVLVVGDDEAGGVVALVIAAVYGALAWLSLRAIRERSPSARRTVVLTAVVVIVLSVLLVKILVGLLTVITGVGLLMVTFAPEREPQ